MRNGPTRPRTYLPTIHPLRSKSAPCRLFFTVPNSRGRSSATTGRCVLTSWPPRFPLSFISCHATRCDRRPSATQQRAAAIETAHSTECDVCSAEGFYAYLQNEGWLDACTGFAQASPLRIREYRPRKAVRLTRRYTAAGTLLALPWPRDDQVELRRDQQASIFPSQETPALTTTSTTFVGLRPMT